MSTSRKRGTRQVAPARELVVEVLHDLLHTLRHYAPHAARITLVWLVGGSLLYATVSSGSFPAEGVIRALIQLVDDDKSAQPGGAMHPDSAVAEGVWPGTPP